MARNSKNPTSIGGKRVGVVNNPQIVGNVPYNCMDAGGWYLVSRVSNVIRKIDEGSSLISTTSQMLAAENENIRKVSRAINGGEIGRPDRKIKTREAKVILLDN